MTPQFGLSQSRAFAGLHCEKRLRLQTHKPEVMEESVANARNFAQGHALGDVARPLLGQIDETIGQVTANGTYDGMPTRPSHSMAMLLR
jgi:hypothetical protein|tara:strand:+ start:6105 stop:6371 length:267 start_codon:yes stop_codon:yes gene_type:complete